MKGLVACHQKTLTLNSLFVDMVKGGHLYPCRHQLHVGRSFVVLLRKPFISTGFVISMQIIITWIHHQTLVCIHSRLNEHEWKISLRLFPPLMSKDKTSPSKPSPSKHFALKMFNQIQVKHGRWNAIQWSWVQVKGAVDRSYVSVWHVTSVIRQLMKARFSPVLQRHALPC